MVQLDLTIPKFQHVEQLRRIREHRCLKNGFACFLGIVVDSNQRVQLLTLVKLGVSAVIPAAAAAGDILTLRDFLAKHPQDVSLTTYVLIVSVSHRTFSSQFRCLSGQFFPLSDQSQHY